LARGEVGSLTIGSLGPAPGGLLAPLLSRFSGRHPDVRVELRAFDFTDTVDGLRDRHADCAFLYLPLDDADLEVTPLLTEERVVVMAKTHRLARRKVLRPADLVDETFIVQPESVPEPWRDHWLLVRENGRRPPLYPHTADKLEDWLHLIASGAGIDTAPAVISRYFPWPMITYIPLVDAEPSTLALAWRRDDTNPLVADVVALALEISSHAVESGTPYSATATA
jgi:LysR family transcriptional regulator, benzoate and cis,cis-muconate-responsive activator of ben and cat genes